VRESPFFLYVDANLLMLVPRSRIISFPLKMEAILSSETSVYTISARRHIPEDCILHINIISLMYMQRIDIEAIA
jgi:hypothetical protein